MENVSDIHQVVINLHDDMQQAIEIRSNYLHQTTLYLLDKVQHTYKIVAHALSSLISNINIKTNNQPNDIKKAIPYWNNAIQKEKHRLQQAKELEAQKGQLVVPIPEKKLLNAKTLVKRLGFKRTSSNSETVSSEQAPKDLQANSQETHFAKRAWYKNLPFYLHRYRALIPATPVSEPHHSQPTKSAEPAGASPK